MSILTSYRVLPQRSMPPRRGWRFITSYSSAVSRQAMDIVWDADLLYRETNNRYGSCTSRESSSSSPKPQTILGHIFRMMARAVLVVHCITIASTLQRCFRREACSWYMVCRLRRCDTLLALLPLITKICISNGKQFMRLIHRERRSSQSLSVADRPLIIRSAKIAP